VIPRLWYVTDGDRGAPGRELAAVILEAARGGVEAVLLRDLALPEASDRLSIRAFEALLRELEPVRERGLRLLVSRRLDLARAYALDGVQLTADSIGLARARELLGTEPWIGYSAHSTSEARMAEREGADYVMLSPVFGTASKPGVSPLGLDVLRSASRALAIPVLALGGVTPDQTRGILSCGAWGIAAVSALGAAADVATAALHFSRTVAESTACIAPSSASS